MADSKTFVVRMDIERRLDRDHSPLATGQWFISQMQAEVTAQKPEHRYDNGMKGPVEVDTYLTKEEWEILQPAIERVCQMVEDRVAAMIGSGDDPMRLTPSGTIQRVNPMIDLRGRW